MRDLVHKVAMEYDSVTDLAAFVLRHCAQAALLGIQFMWTTGVQEALLRARHDKHALSHVFQKQKDILRDLTTMTTGELASRMERVKVETLVTIQVHQRDELEKLYRRVKETKAKVSMCF